MQHKNSQTWKAGCRSPQTFRGKSDVWCSPGYFYLCSQIKKWLNRKGHLNLQRPVVRIGEIREVYQNSYFFQPRPQIEWILVMKVFSDEQITSFIFHIAISHLFSYLYSHFQIYNLILY